MAQTHGAIDILESSPRDQRGETGRDDDVLAEQRPVEESDAVIDTDALTNPGLEQNKLERFYVRKLQVINIQDRFELRGQFRLEAEIVKRVGGEWGAGCLD